MSSKYTAERLSVEVLKWLLKLLFKGGRLTASALLKQITKRLPLAQLKQFRLKGGSQELRRIVYYAKQQGWVKYQGRGGDLALTLTDKGRAKLEAMHFEELHLPRGQRWDGKWRIISFDIPEDKRAARDALRRLLRELGFVLMHQSVWVQPLPCRRQVEQIKKSYGVGSHITLLEVTDFDQEAYFRRYFKSKIAG